MFFEDDIILIAESKEEMKEKLKKWRDSLENGELKVNKKRGNIFGLVRR